MTMSKQALGVFATYGCASAKSRFSIVQVRQAKVVASILSPILLVMEEEPLHVLSLRAMYSTDTYPCYVVNPYCSVVWVQADNVKDAEVFIWLESHRKASGFKKRTRAKGKRKE